MKLHHHRISSEGIRLALYEKKPIVIDGTTPTVLLIHSASFSSLPEYDLQYKDYSLMDHLADAGIHVYALDIRGYGNSDKPHESFWVTTDVAADDVATAVEYICSENCLDKISLFGWSWGSQIAGLYSQRAPSRVERLIFSAPFWKGLNVELPEVDDPWRYNTYEGALVDFLEISSVDPGAKEAFARECMKLDKRVPAGSWHDLRQLRVNPILDPRRISQPLLLIYGEHDHLVDKDDILEFSKLVGSTKKCVVEIKESDHMMHLELNRHDFYNEMITFLKDR